MGNGNQWKMIYGGMLDVDFVPGVAPVKSGTFAATNLELSLQVSDVTKMKMSDVIKSIAEASNVPVKDVVVKEMKFEITARYAFDTGVTLDQARTAIAKANSVVESQVTVTVVRRRRLSVWRRLAVQELQSKITTTDGTVAAAVQTAAADTTKLAQALKQVVPSAPAPTLKQSPTVKVALKTQVLSNSTTPVVAPSGTALAQSLQKNMGQTVQATVKNVGSSSCNNGVCVAPTTKPTTAKPTTKPGDTNTHVDTAAVVPSFSVFSLLLANLVVADSLSV